MLFDTASTTNQQVYRLLTGGVTPRPIAWISTLSEDGIPNLAPYSFFNVVSCNPPVLMYSQVNPQSGDDKDTLRNLMATKECVVHIVDTRMLEKMNLSCAALAPEQSEFDFADIDYCDSHTVKPYSVRHARVRYECALREVMRMSTQPGGGSMVLLDVKCVYVDDALWQNGLIDQHGLDSVGKMGGDFYSSTGALLELARP